jgi:hypothetical protein
MDQPGLHVALFLKTHAFRRNLSFPDDSSAWTWFSKRDDARMPNTIPLADANPFDNGTADAAVAELPIPTTDAGLPLPASVAGATATGAAGIECGNCKAPMSRGQTYCRRCGFYPTLNTFVEVQPWETAGEGKPTTQEPAKSHIEVWKSLIPRWGWYLIAGAIVLVLISLIGRFMPMTKNSRALWTYAQFGIGIIAAITAHVMAYMHAIMVNDQLSFIDILLKPWVVWKVSFDELPKSFKRVSLGSWGLTAALCAAFVVAGVRYDEIIDWGKVPPKKKLKPLLPGFSMPKDSNMTMEEALEAFADQAGIEMTDEERLKEKGPNRNKMVKCLIVGYTPFRESDFERLVLAVQEGEKWRCVGMVSEGIPPDDRSTLNRRMRMIMRGTPAVPCGDIKAFWLQPKLMCTVWYEEWNEERLLLRPFFDKLQPDFDPKKPEGTATQ